MSRLYRRCGLESTLRPRGRQKGLLMRKDSRPFFWSLFWSCHAQWLFPIWLLIAGVGVGVGKEVYAEQPNLGPLLVHTVRPISGEKILPDQTLLPGERSTTLKITSCRGEYEPASFVVRAVGAGVTELSFNSTDLTSSSSGATIPAANLDLKIVKSWFQSYNAWNDIYKSSPEDFRQRLVPELLLKDDELVHVDHAGEKNLVKIVRGNTPEYVWINQKRLAPTEQVLPTVLEFPVKDSDTLQPISVPSGTNKQIWVTVHVPEDASPGEYSGQIHVSSNGVSLGIIEIQLSVPTFALAEPKLTYSIYYRAKLDPQRASIGSEYRSAEQMRAELANLSGHGVKNPTLLQSITNESLLNNALQLRRELGMNRGALYFLGFPTTELVETLKVQIPRLLVKAHSYGYSQLYEYGRDEAKGKELEAQRGVWSLIHGMGAKVFVAGYTENFGVVGDLLDTVVYYGQPSNGEADKWHSVGHTIFGYANPQSGPENPFLFRLNYGLVLWANDYDGAMPYAYQHCFGSCWNDVDHPTYRDHNFTYPTADGVIDTLAWEGFREAVDDVRYLTTLENLLKKGGGIDSSALRQASSFLNTLKNEIRNRQVQSSKYNASMKIDLDEIRSINIMHIKTIWLSGVPPPPAAPTGMRGLSAK